MLTECVSAGPCKALGILYYYDSNLGCTTFEYGGCRGNGNRFATEEECQRACPGSDVPVCEQPLVTGPCKAAFRRWGFKQETGKCEEFIYGGCGGNDNRFETQEECEEKCPAKEVPVCEQPQKVGPCRAAINRYWFNGKECELFSWGGCEPNGNNFETIEQCQEACGGGGEPNDDICSLPAIPEGQKYTCLAYIPSWTYRAGKCVEFIYGGCGGTENIFSTEEECESRCGGAIVGKSL
jgi:papilin